MRQEESSEMAQAIWFAGWDRYWDFFCAAARRSRYFPAASRSRPGEDGIEELKGGTALSRALHSGSDSGHSAFSLRTVLPSFCLKVLTSRVLQQPS